MRHPWIAGSLFVVLLFTIVRALDAQSIGPTEQALGTYKLRVAVDEVSLTFHAKDQTGLPLTDLKLDELSVLDNGKPPRRMLALQRLEDLPVRAGILMDMSQSMDDTRSTARTIAMQYAQRLLRPRIDQAFVINFGRRQTVAQPWTSNSYALSDGIRDLQVKTGGNARISGTAVFDAIYRACSDQFGAIDNADTRNFLLLFSDGEDNASSHSLEEAAAMCQRTNTAIYAFRPSFGAAADGENALAELAAESGGRVFSDHASAAQNLRTMEADLRDQYRVIYRPLDSKHDGSFHRVRLQGPPRAQALETPSGYYAPSH